MLRTTRKRLVYRHTLDLAAGILIRLGGVSVIVFVILVFVYLLRQVMPLFGTAEMNLQSQHGLPGQEEVVHLTLERQNQIMGRLIQKPDSVAMQFYDVRRKVITDEELIANGNLLAFATDSAQRRTLALSVQEGRVILMRHDYEEDFSTSERIMVPIVSYPFGRESISLSPNNAALTQIAVLSDQQGLTLVGYDAAGNLYGKNLLRSENLITGEISREEEDLSLPSLNQIAGDIKDILLFENRLFLIAANEAGEATVIRLDGSQPTQEISLTEGGVQLTGVYRMLGDSSLLTTDANGLVNQWFMHTGESQKKELVKIRSFDAGEPIATIKQVENSKSFLILTESGRLLFINAPAERVSLDEILVNSADDLVDFAISPRANSLITIDKEQQLSYYAIKNLHAEISIHRLIGKIWYENYEEPKWAWQASSAADDFEPKYSLVPLTFGTLKAAFYAMLFSAPLGIAAAIYTSFFMGSGLRRKVKPVIELMEAFPTVILGFIAGLVLAPYFEKHLPGIFMLILFLPPIAIAFGFLYHLLPSRYRNAVGPGWTSIMLIPLFFLTGYLLMQLSPIMELFFFGGDLRVWLSQHGFDYNQRNAMVVGIAMGLAVIPSIYSIAEDSLFSVPSNMVQGAYALGATPLQNVILIVLPASLSGILSALMIGFGRAVGETMIVLMATGNTPVMNMSIFTGLRTLAANIAVELPESPVGGSHFRILFLCGLTLFLFTFIINTLAEIIRHRIRKRYANI